MASIGKSLLGSARRRRSSRKTLNASSDAISPEALARALLSLLGSPEAATAHLQATRRALDVVQSTAGGSPAVTEDGSSTPESLARALISMLGTVGAAAFHLEATRRALDKLDIPDGCQALNAVEESKHRRRTSSRASTPLVDTVSEHSGEPSGEHHDGLSNYSLRQLSLTRQSCIFPDLDAADTDTVTEALRRSSSLESSEEGQRGLDRWHETLMAVGAVASVYGGLRLGFGL